MGDPGEILSLIDIALVVTKILKPTHQRQGVNSWVGGVVYEPVKNRDGMREATLSCKHK